MTKFFSDLLDFSYYKSFMFFTLAILSMIGYAIQGTFLVKYAREMDPLSLAIYRNLSLGITMLPIFFFVDASDLLFGKNIWLILLGASITGAISLGFLFKSQKSLPVGIAGAFTGIRVLLLLLWAYIFLQEILSIPEISFILIILGGITFLSVQENHMPHLDGRTLQGFLSILLASFFGSIAFFLISLASRTINPLLAGYIWELGIGVSALILGIFRYLFSKRKIQKISGKRFGEILSISSWTLLGTGTFVLAVNYGPLGIVNALGSSAIIVSTIFSHILYDEKLNRNQWIGICIVALGIFGLKLAG